MAHLPTARILRAELAHHGPMPVVVFDVDEFTRVVEAAGTEAGTLAIASLRGLFEKMAVPTSGRVYALEPDRFLVALSACTYDEAVAFAERCVDELRLLGLPGAPGSGRPMSVTAAVVSVESAADVDRFARRVNELLLDGKSTGGDAVIRDR